MIDYDLKAIVILLPYWPKGFEGNAGMRLSLNITGTGIVIGDPPSIFNYDNTLMYQYSFNKCYRFRPLFLSCQRYGKIMYTV